MAHVLALAEAKTHPFDDVIRAAEALGATLDQRVIALGTAEANHATRAEIVALIQDIGSAATHAGSWPEVESWARGHFATIRDHARRLFDDDLGITIAPAVRSVVGTAAGPARGAAFWSAFRGGR